MRASWAGMGMAAVLFVLGLSFSPTAVDRGEASRIEVPAMGAVELSGSAISAQDNGTAAPTLQVDEADEDDDRVLVSLATFGVAVAAVIVGSAGYLLRRWLGLVKPPPAQGPEH